MGKTKALIYENPGQPVFKEIETADPGEECVGISIIASSLCNTSELRSFKGGYETGYGVMYPMKVGEPGHEAVGRIVKAGRGSEGFALGDIVAMTGHGGEPCHRGYVNRNCGDIAKIDPKGRDIRNPSILEMYGCAYHCAMTPLSARDYSGKKVMVFGMGAMGLCTVQILNNLDTREVIAVDLSKERLKIAAESGADHTLLPSEINSEKHIDIIIECSGSVNGQETACALAPGVLIFSSYNTKAITIRQNLWFDAHTTIYNPGIVTSENFKKVAQLYNKELIEPSMLIQKYIKPNEKQYLETIDEIKEGKIVKAVMDWRDDEVSN